MTDGDTLIVLRGRTVVEVRLHGIGAPEAGQDFDAARQPVEGDVRAYHVFQIVRGQAVPPGDRGGLGVDASPLMRR